VKPQRQASGGTTHTRPRVARENFLYGSRRRRAGPRTPSAAALCLSDGRDEYCRGGEHGRGGFRCPELNIVVVWPGHRGAGDVAPAPDLLASHQHRRPTRYRHISQQALTPGVRRRRLSAPSTLDIRAMLAHLDSAELSGIQPTPWKLSGSVPRRCTLRVWGRGPASGVISGRLLHYLIRFRI
jgi:hypothetical protein